MASEIRNCRVWFQCNRGSFSPIFRRSFRMGTWSRTFCVRHSFPRGDRISNKKRSSSRERIIPLGLYWKLPESSRCDSRLKKYNQCTEALFDCQILPIHRHARSPCFDAIKRSREFNATGFRAQTETDRIWAYKNFRLTRELYTIHAWCQNNSVASLMWSSIRNIGLAVVNISRPFSRLRR